MYYEKELENRVTGPGHTNGGRAREPVPGYRHKMVLCSVTL